MTQLFTQLDQLPSDSLEKLRNAVLVIGNFDGVHLGHAQVLAQAKEYAEKENAKLGVMMFEPHPRRHFAPDAPPFRLTKLQTRRELLEQHGVDFILALPFTAELAALPAQDFIADILCQQLAIRAVAVGEDFRFGNKRAGDVAMLETLGAIHGFAVLMTQAVLQKDGTTPYSSSAIRAALEAGEPQTAAKLLGRAWGLRGEIVQGEQRGRTIGFPTANMLLGDYLRPALGVYAVRARILNGDFGGQEFNGVANLGMRPTFDGTAPRLETHLFDFSGDLYGAEAEVQLLHFIRPEQKFSGLEELQAQIKLDVEAAKNIIAA